MAEFLGRLLASVAAWRMFRMRHKHELEPKQVEAVREQLDDVSERTVPASRRAELLVATLLALAALFGFGFTAVYALDGGNNQLLGLAIGGMFALLAAGAIIAGKFVVPQETSVEDRGELLAEDSPEEILEIVQAGGEGISRRLLLIGAGGAAGVAVTTAVVTTLASLGPRLTRIHDTPWHHGVRFVDTDGRPYHADEIQIGSFYTALPEDAYWEQLGAPLLVVRLPGHYIHLPASRAGWAPRGILAFSKICPHAACAISLYRYPTFAPTSDAQPAFTCPCHYSTFLPGEGGKLLFGPAGRPLPQLPVMVDTSGHLRAAGGFDEDVGPAWFDVHTPQST
ncbi:MAG TPA: Rieske (2Fe-2S) protein [Solirubrobacteraceae bacterium]|jgi:ubiquinol-cytochrome c reductase iron-sulfur subunit|nr:Rieske (2Fe-2S) protein [Solirubrobacteraceae bacterium]